MNRYVELFNSIDGLILKCILVPLAPCIGLSDEPFRDITKESISANDNTYEKRKKNNYIFK